MNYQDRTREELIAALLDIQQENRDLKRNAAWNTSSINHDDAKHLEFSKSKEYFELLFNTSPDAALITRLSDGMVVNVNDGFTKLTGFTKEETLGATSVDIKLWKNPDDRLLLVNELMKNGLCENFEAAFVRKDGSSVVGLISAKTFLLNETMHIFSLTRDITGRKQLDKEITLSEVKFRSLYANMIDGSALHSLVYNDQGVPEDYLIIDVNPAFESLLGISREAVINKTSKEAYGVDKPPYFEIYSRVALTGNPEIFETYFAPLDKHFSISVYCPFKGSFATIFENITERKKAENENERIQKLLEDSQRIGKVGGWEINLDTKELNWTKEMYHIHEVDLTFVPQVDLRASFYTPESLPEVDKAVQHVIEHGGSYEIDSEIVTAKGNRRWVKAMGMADLENRRVFGFFQDITDRKHAEAELKIKNEQLKELNATKDKFFSIIAHDLKTPFSGILGFSQILKDEARNLDIDSIEDYADVLNSTAKQTYKLLENLLDWARMQQGGFHFEPKTTSLNYLLEIELEGLKNSADRKNINLVNETDKEIIVTVDEKILSTVLRNLISNAIKFTPKNGKINVKAIMKVDHLEFSISDTGIGMEKETINKLFKIETSFTSRGTENEKGTGLGLLLCKEFVEKHGGTIWVDSEKGKGSRFTFSIPQTTNFQ